MPGISAADAAGDADTVTISRDEYEALKLAELALDRIDYDRASARTEGEERVPHAVVKRLCEGDNPVRVWREHRGLTLTAVANRAGIGKGYLSQIETGQRDGTVSAYRALARVLRVDIDDLVATEPDALALLP